MKKLLLILLMIFFAASAFAATNGALTNGITTLIPTEQWSNSTFFIALHVDTFPTVTVETLVDFNTSIFEPIRYYFQTFAGDGRLYMQATAFCLFGSCDDAVYYVSGFVSGKDYLIAIQWNLTDTVGDTPIVYVNGVRQTVVTDTVGDGSGVESGGRVRYIGYNSLNLNPLAGSDISAVGFCGTGFVTKMSDALVRSMTGSYLMDFPYQLQGVGANTSLCTHYWTFETLKPPVQNTTIKDSMGLYSSVGAVDLNVYQVGGTPERFMGWS